MLSHAKELNMTRADLLILPPERDLPPGELSRRRQHLVLEASATVAGTPRQRRRIAGSGRRPGRLLALATAVVVAALLSIPAFGVGEKIVSLFAGGHDPEAPVPTASDVLIASGKAGVPWKILATRSDQGLCLDLFHRVGDDRFGGGCYGYADIRGDLPPDLRGDPATRCIAAPEGPLVPCGSLPRHWIGPIGSGSITVGLERYIHFGPLAVEVTSVELILTDGQTIRAHVVEQPGGLPLNFYWAARPCPLEPVTEAPYADKGVQMCTGGGPEVQMAIARDAEGRVLERRVPAWNGNPTGDPDGPAAPSQRQMP
jgi:hypothetical protein